MSVLVPVLLLFGLRIVPVMMVSGVSTARLCLETWSHDCTLILENSRYEINKNEPGIEWDGFCVTYKGNVQCEEEIVVQCTDPDGIVKDVFYNWTGCDLQTTTDPAPSASPLNVTAAPPAGGSSRPYRAVTIGSAIIFVAIIIIGCILYRSRKILKSCGDEEASPPKTDGGGVEQALLNGHGADHKRTTSGIIV